MIPPPPQSQKVLTAAPIAAQRPLDFTAQTHDPFQVLGVRRHDLTLGAMHPGSEYGGHHLVQHIAREGSYDPAPTIGPAAAEHTNAGADQRRANHRHGLAVRPECSPKVVARQHHDVVGQGFRVIVPALRVDFPRVMLPQVGDDMVHRRPGDGLARDLDHFADPSCMFRWIAANNAGPGASWISSMPTCVP